MTTVRDLTYPPIVAAAKVALRLLAVRLDVRGAEHVPRHGPAVLAVNHLSYVDFLLGGFAALPSGRRVRFLAKRELFDSRWTGALMRSLHHIEVDRSTGAQSYAEALGRLRTGEVVGVFPEATISRAMQLKQFKTGAARLAADAGAPLVPVVLWGGQRVLTKDHPRDLSRGHRVAITVGEPLRPAGHDPVADTAALRARMAALLDETVRRCPVSPQGQWWAPAAYGGTAPSPAEAARLDAEERLRRAACR